ncbi:MAG: hypothetical protein HQL17_01375 [Candidatus Omnitrophica bacterium]|nr:hypothetical protein [Candidatus Omnitrophota bacterium]
MKNADYFLRPDGAFVVENYNQNKPFANFFPGIAGEWGIPMWVFYTNRGQGIAAFGIESKDKAIMEFQPANKAYRLTSTHGFRTFLKVKKGNVQKFYEPFLSPVGSPFKVRQTMVITSHELTLEEVNTTLGIAVTVTYFTVPEESFAGLMRKVTVKNISKGAMSCEMIDGLPVILPFGQNDWVMKNMCRTIEAWYKVRNLDKKAPYFQLNVEAADVPQVKQIKEGNFYFAFDPKAKPGVLLEPVVEAGIVFGQATDLRTPERFITEKNFNVAKTQQTDNRTPSAMSHAIFALKSGASKEVVSVTGFTRSVADLNATVKKVTGKGFEPAKRKRNADLISGIKSLAFTHSASAAFDAYAQQTFLDNVLRGGLPVSLQTSEGPAVFNVYSRKHGDLERDYNAFKLSPTFLSQGNGNYRDVNQNRRNDVWFNADLKESAVVNFFSLGQADGYNPLVVCGMAFVADDDMRIDSLLKAHVKSGDTHALKAFLKKGFMPGDLFNFIVDHNVSLKLKPREFLAQVLGICQKSETAQHGEGFWTDHWHYNLDLVESYLALYPEGLAAILLENKNFTFYHNSCYVQPRDKRYVLTARGVRQYHSLHEGSEHKDRGHKLRVRHGQGEVYHTNLLVKMLCLIANKAATLDPSGIGIDMEANKPNWYDSLNGLPGLLGSSISETFEVKRFALFALNALDKLAVDGSENVAVFEELAGFVQQLSDILSEKNDLDYWKKSNTAKEDYREKVRDGITGVEKEVSFSAIRNFLELVVIKVGEGVTKARRADGLFPTYFYHKVTRYEPVEGASPAKEGPCVRPLAFERHDMPLFLEGFVHALRSEQDSAVALSLHEKVRKSAIFDADLKMYKVNTDITSETEEIGRTRVFPRGWLENESVWLHMEYKYLLELLRCGLYDAFYQDLSTCCVAFMDPVRYGRSILENSSFIASSAHPDKDLQGQGFVARLSGSTAEFIHIWMFMNSGDRPFGISAQGQLELIFRPALKGKFFTAEKSVVEVPALSGKVVSTQLAAATYAFNFMGKTLVVYHNPQRKDTFGAQKVEPKSVVLHYAGKKIKKIDGGVIPSPFAEDVRSGKVLRIDVELA